jgi:hypothetical protein
MCGIGEPLALVRIELMASHRVEATARYPSVVGSPRRFAEAISTNAVLAPSASLSSDQVEAGL